MNKFYLHPLILISGVWGFVLYLYGLHWSELQIYEVDKAYPFLIILFGVFSYVFLFFWAAKGVLKDKGGSVEIIDALEFNYYLSRRIKKWFFIWICVSVVEVLFSGGIPILWLINGSEKTYFDFGLPTIHGLANGLVSALSLISFFIYMNGGGKKYFIYSISIILWGVIAVTRQIVIVNLLQFIVVYYAFKPPTLLGFLKSILFSMLFIVFFGWLGDLRTGADKFVGLAMPSADYPDYLPSGVLWVYMYAVTPLMNLINTINFNCGCDSYFFSNTITPLLPSFIRGIALGSGQIEKGDVVSEAFNVSTAFVDPYSDMGYLGVFIFSILISIITTYFWYRRDNVGFLIFTVFAQSLILTIFYNHFFSLPVISQIFWINIFLKNIGPSKL